MFRRFIPAVVSIIGVSCPAGSAAEDGLSRCAELGSAEERLACYDELASRETPQRLTQASYLTRAWKLGPADGAPRRFVDILSYRPDYVISRVTDSPNQRPRSPSTGRSSVQDLTHNEAAIQASFKTELISREAFESAGLTPALRPLGIGNARLWFGYTQKMAWQAVNHGQSRPIRDTNYEPEAILTLGAANPGNGFKLLNLGASHESNGIDPKQHRGWSRLYAQGGWEWDRFSVLARAWRIIPQSDDDNPNIDRFMGPGDVVLRYQSAGGHVSSVLLRRNFAWDRGFVQIDSATPALKFLGGLKFHLQFSSGYGMTLIDYNHRQNTLGIGISFGDW